MKNRAATKVQHVAIGRRVAALRAPTEAARLAGRVKRAEERDREQRAALAARDAEIARLHDLVHAGNVEAIARERGRSAHLRETDTKRLVNILENQRREWIQSGKPEAKFPAYKIVAQELHRLGASAVAPAPSDTSEARAGQLPPPAPEGGPPMHAHDRDAEQARRDEQRQAAHDRGRQLAEQVTRDREAYRAALRRHGLADPTGGTPGTGRGHGY